VLGLKTPWREGATHLPISPLELTRRLAALVPCLRRPTLGSSRTACERQLRGDQFGPRSVAEGSASAGQARDLTAGKPTPKLSDPTADGRGRQWPTPTGHLTAEIGSREADIGVTDVTLS